jgi:hypothetical protein
MLNYSANGPSGYNLTNSLRFRTAGTTYMSRTPASAGNRRTWTLSAWVKVSTSASEQRILNAYYDSTCLYLFNQFGYSGIYTTAVFRDPSAWYHVVWVYDTTQATASNRLKIYVNNIQQTLQAYGGGAPTYPVLNFQGEINSVALHDIGGYGSAPYVGTSIFDGYMTEINFIDGQQLTPSSFGNTNSTTGVWQPAKYTGTYGTNGFYLNFTDIALTSGSNTGLGKDNSGNGNYWNTNNISVTAGTTYDAMTDSPTLTSATVANYATLNAVNQSSQTFSNANLTTSFSAVGGNRSTIGMSSGKWYWEVNPSTCPSFTMIGIASSTVAITGDVSAGNCITYMSQTGYWWRNNVGTAYGATYTTTDTIGIALDVDNNSITFYKNGVSQGAITSVTLNTDTWFATIGNAAASATVANFNFGQRPFSYTPPTGFVALNTFNLPSSTIPQGNKYMDATLYTGNGSTQTITNTASFKPDLVWTKARSIAYSHVLYDSVRGTGTTKALFSDSTAAEGSNSSNVNLTSYNSNGWSVGSTSSTNILNDSGTTFVGWQWQAGQGTTSSNTNGTITSTVSVNATAGFSVFTYTGNATANATIGHGLGVAPKMFIIKTRSGTSEWLAYHVSTGKDGFMQLQSTSAFTSSSNYWGSTGPTSTTIQINGGGGVNNNGSTYVVYAWAEIAGFSKFGSYTGNGSADGPFVYTGFRPKYIMYKSSSSAYNWCVDDTSRSPYNISSALLNPNLSAAENTGALEMDILSNGFKIKSSDATFNASGGTYIYMAFAENPFKNALAK